MTLCCVIQEDVEDLTSAHGFKVKEAEAGVLAGTDQLLRQAALHDHCHVISRGNWEEVITEDRSGQGRPREGVEF